jgi:hypothetical protein
VASDNFAYCTEVALLWPCSRPATCQRNAYGLKEHCASRSLTYHQIIADPRDLIETK